MIYMLNATEIKKKYNEIAGSVRGDYEVQRWQRDGIQIAVYKMTRLTVERLALPIPFSHFLEVGPGPGTWTKFFIKKRPEAQFDLVDISAEMIKQAQENLSSTNRVKYIIADFLDFSSDYKYDFFFSARAIEYFRDKDILIKKISELMQKGGQGFLITKTPHYWRQRILFRRPPVLHRGQISHSELKKLLEERGFGAVKIYPATIIVPLFRSAKINMFFYRLFSKSELNFISQFFSESYCVQFVKL